MAKGRKNGCPVNIKNWIVEIRDPATEAYTRIFGLNSLSNAVDGDTEDGSSDSDVWAEPYITKRSGSVSLEGKEVVVESTGAKDEGQELLSSYASLSGCDADATLRFTDPYGHAWVADYIVTSRETSSDDSGTNLTWELEQVGEAEVLPYVSVASVALKDGLTAIQTLTMEVGDAPKIITADFVPITSSNKRFKVTNNKRSICTIGSVTETGFSITPVSLGTATITIATVNGNKIASLAVTVSAAIK